MSHQPSKHARTVGRKSRAYEYRADRGMGQKGDEFYSRRSGGRKPVVGDSLIVLEQKLAAITLLKP